jgi:pyruvate,water dikinase
MQLPYTQNISHVIDMIKANVNVEWDYNPAGGKVYKQYTNDTIIENLRTPLSTIPKFLMSKVLPRAKDAVRNRERTKSKAVMSVNEIRNGIRGLGKLMVNEGFLPESELIFHMTKDEIKKVILFRDVTIVSKAIRRQNLYPQWAKYRFPDLNFGVPRPMSFYVQSGNLNNSNILVKGTIVCGGIVEGRACVLQDFSEVHKIQKGDILVTYSTDIGWSPYFPLLRGLCTELGGLISHAAVVSRECNLPCIVGAKGASSAITTGRTILLNADEGCICSVD